MSADQVYAIFKTEPRTPIGQTLIAQTGWTESSLRRAKRSALAGRNYKHNGGRPDCIPQSVQQNLFGVLKHQGLYRVEFDTVTRLVQYHHRSNHGNQEIN